MDVEIDFAPDGGKTRVRIERVLAVPEGHAVTTDWRPPEGQRERLSLRLHLPQHHLRELLGEIVEIPQVLAIEQAAGGRARALPLTRTVRSLPNGREVMAKGSRSFMVVAKTMTKFLQKNSTSNLPSKCSKVASASLFSPPMFSDSTSELPYSRIFLRRM